MGASSVSRDVHTSSFSYSLGLGMPPANLASSQPVSMDRWHFCQTCLGRGFERTEPLPESDDDSKDFSRDQPLFMQRGQVEEPRKGRKRPRRDMDPPEDSERLWEELMS